MVRPVAFARLLAGALAAAAPAQEKVATVEGVTEYRLANGARVLLYPESSRPTVTVNMTVLVGSRHEGYGEAGMGHPLGHMGFKGPPQKPHPPTAAPGHCARLHGSTQVGCAN